MRNPDDTTNFSAIITIVLLIILCAALLYGADAQQAIRETPLDRKLINTRILFVQQGGGK